MKNRIPLIIALLLAFFAWHSQFTIAAYDPGIIIEDHELFGGDLMSVEEIQMFLDSHRGLLKTYYTQDIDGRHQPAAAIIYNAAFRHNINPRILLVLLQKEQGLITDPTPYASQYDWAMGYAVCDNCDTNHPQVSQYKGFARQVDRAAWRLRYYVEHIDQFNFRPGRNYLIDNVSVYIQNLATAALYNYTPHIQGNEIFYKLWQSWFYALSHPDGTLLQAFGEPGVWLIKDGVRHAFLNKAALTTRYSTSRIVQVPRSTIEQYPIGDPIGFRQYALLRIPTGKIYLLIDDELRWIADEDTFRHLGFMPDEIEHVSQAELAYFRHGVPITMETIEPFGALVQDPETYGIFFVRDGVKQPLVAPELLSLNYSHLRVRKGTLSELDHYTLGSPVLLSDGLLVKTANEAKVYVVSSGKRLPIASEYTFNALGYDWTKIHVISDKLMNLHQVGNEMRVMPPISDEEASELVSPLIDRDLSD